MIPDRTFHCRIPHHAAIAFIAGVALHLSGCGDDWQADTYPAGGEVYVNGQPATEAVVELRSTGTQPDSRNSRPWGIVQADGTYVLTTYAKGDGAPPGDYAVTLRWPSDISSPSHFDRLSGDYDEPERAPLAVTIAEGENTLPRIDLWDVAVLPVDKPAGARTMPRGPNPRLAR